VDRSLKSDDSSVVVVRQALGLFNLWARLVGYRMSVSVNKNFAERRGYIVVITVICLLALINDK